MPDERDTADETTDEPTATAERVRAAGGHPTDDPVEYWAGIGKLGPIGLDQ